MFSYHLLVDHWFSEYKLIYYGSKPKLNSWVEAHEVTHAHTHAHARSLQNKLAQAFPAQINIWLTLESSDYLVDWVDRVVSGYPSF